MIIANRQTSLRYLFFILFFIILTQLLFAQEPPITYTIQTIGFIGNQEIPSSELVQVVPIRAGQEYSRDSVIEGKYNILSFYGEHGYIYAKVKELLYVNETTGDIALTYEISEGKKAYFGKISLVGNTKTHDRVIWRKLTIRPGEVYNRKEVFTSQRKLMLLGYFDEVKIEPANPTVEEEIVDLIISVKERQTGLISLGTGYSTEEGVRGYARYRQTNLFGKGQRFGASVYLSEQGDLVERGREVNLDFYEPYLFNTMNGFGSNIYFRRENLENYSLRRRGGKMYVERSSADGRIKYSAQYRLEENQMCYIKNTVDPEIIALEGTKTDLGVFSVNLTKDTRDNLANPHRGQLQSLTAELAYRWLGSEADYYKVYADLRTYFQLFKSEWILGFRTAGGFAEPFGHSDSIPIYERFYAGGGESVRGIKDRYLGPKDLDGYPVGGDAILLLNVELRFPIYKQFGGVVFYDYGNVWEKLSDVNLNDMQSSVGIGFRYQTPIGPFRIDYGIKIPKEDNGRFHISVGQTF
ncbi:MAG: outer membrane protein assembly factor BamA [bacterium]|nr:outer membrane protein assembly factor BamA [bacterium]